MRESTEYVQSRLFEMQDKKYAQFNSKLLPTIKNEAIIGVRIPLLRKEAKSFWENPLSNDFMKALPHKYFEENNLHAFLIEQIEDFDEAIKALDSFLPYVDNWATCDSMRPKVFKDNKEKLLEKILEWLGSTQTYTVRFAIEMLMIYFLDDNFKLEYAETVANVKSNEYYVNMMLAWYFATALSKHPDEILPFFQQKRLEKFVHNKAIQKARESFRITKEQKEFLLTLKIK